MKSKPLSYSELSKLNFMQGVVRYWDWRVTIVFFGLGWLFVYHSNPPVDSLDDPRVRVVEGVIVRVTGCLAEKRSGYVDLEDSNGIVYGVRIKNCSKEEREQFLGKSVRAYRYVKDGKLSNSSLEIHFDGKPWHTYEDNYGRHKFNAALLYFALSFIPLIMISGHRWRKEKAAVLAREKRDQATLQADSSADKQE